MKSYKIYDTSGKFLFTVQATSVDDAFNQASSTFDSRYIGRVEPQYTANVTGLDPLWILLAVLGAVLLFGKKGQHRRFL